MCLCVHPATLLAPAQLTHDSASQPLKHQSHKSSDSLNGPASRARWCCCCRYRCCTGRF